jgi:type 2 lantibiotic biosynthesis protein LanM
VPAQPFQDPDWYRASTLAERIAALRGAPRTRANGEVDAGRAQRRLRRWRSQAPFTTGSYFAQRLALEGVSEDDLFYLLGEPIDAVQERSPTSPGWLVKLAQAFSRPATSGPIPFPEVLRGQVTAGLLGAIEPLLSQGRDRVHEGVERLTRTQADTPFDPCTVEDVLCALVPGRLLHTASSTLALELNVARLQGALKGDTPEERFRSFLERVREPGVALALLREYPVLARQLAIQVDNWVVSSMDFLQRLCADWKALRAEFSPGDDPGSLVEVRGGVGDMHRGGRSVLIARFSSGLRVVYKPRPLAVDVHFQELLTWLNERGDQPPFRTLRIIDRDTYGWAEFVTAWGCTSADEVRRFYERQGAYLALLYAAEAMDFHSENLIAAGEHPVLIDLETLFHPRYGKVDTTQADLAAVDTIAYSVLRVGLLPQRLWSGAESEGIDLSGLAAGAGQLTPWPVPYWEGAGTDEMRLARKRLAMPGAQNRPSLRGMEVNLLDHVEEIVAGFTTVYRLLLRYRNDLLSTDGPLARFADDEMRVILRPTRTYALLLRESSHPDLLRDALDRDCFFDWLWAEVKTRPELVKVIRAEREDLQQGDIPMFTARPRSRDIWTSANERVTAFLDEPGMALVRRRVRRLSEEDLARQLWLVRASFAVLPLAAESAPRPNYHPGEPQTVADREGLLAAARAVGDRLDALALRGAGDVSWIGLTFLNDRSWSIRPLGAHLYDGLPGVALFLAYLGVITGAERYTALAHAALTLLRRQVERGRSFWTAIGGFSGWGGVIYTYAHLAALWEWPALLQEAEALVELLAPLIERDERLDLIGGAAGCIGGLLCLDRCAPSARTRAAAIRCGDRLLARAQAGELGSAWLTPLPAAQPLTGFGYGAAGMAWALLELAARTGEERFRMAGRAAIAYERSLVSPGAGNRLDQHDRAALGPPGNNGQASHATGWCRGAPGIGLARLRALPHTAEGETRAEIAAALQTTLAHGFGSNHSLCHGDLGNMELLLQAKEALPDLLAPVDVNRLAAMIIESIGRNGWVCGTPSGLETPGLMTGLAGIGYGLLRLAEPTHAPSLLVLAPPAP